MLEKDTISMHLVREALRESGLSGQSPTELLSEVGIERALLDSADARVSAKAYARLWRLLSSRNDDEFFGMDPRKLRAGSFEYLCRAGMAQPTLFEAIEAVLGFLSLALERMPARLLRQKSVAEIVLRETDPRRSFSYFTYWMIVHGVICWLAGRRIPILAIELRCEEPPYCDDYRVMFSENLRFGRPLTRMVFPSECLDLPIRRTAAQRSRFLASAPANILVKYRDNESLASRIKHHMRALPIREWPDAEALSNKLCISVSTLRRRLAEEGQSYQQLKDSIRKELAIAWLGDSRVSVAEIADRLGFSDVSSFYKAFRKWSGSNPGHFRSLILNEVQG